MRIEGLARLLALLAATGLIAIAAAAAPPEPTYVDALTRWRAQADAGLRKERGWLSIVSRDELGPGTHRIGSGPDNEVLLPKALAPAHLGTITVADGKARLALAKGLTMRTVEKDDVGEEFNARDLVAGDMRLEWVTAGRLSLQFVKREDGKIVVRAADRDSARRKTFAGRVWYEPRAEFRVPAKFVPHAQGATIPIANVRGEIAYEKVAGSLEFTIAGRKIALDALDDDGSLFIIFRDGTSGSTTYPPGRFLVVDKAKDGTWIVDLNKAYNPPCAFSAFTTCPLPPPQNWLGAEIAAGERYAGRKS
jgi:uncharacterized protein (DUF1684 family)